jgi:hypothetical protein
MRLPVSRPGFAHTPGAAAGVPGFVPVLALASALICFKLELSSAALCGAGHT